MGFISRANIKHITFNDVESTCNKARRSALPKSPKDVQQINELFETPHVRDNYGLTKRPETKDGQPGQPRSMFFKRAYECEAYAYCIFASDDVIKALQQNSQGTTRKLFADATFKICPVGKFTQVLILFADLLGHVRNHIVSYAYIIDVQAK